MTRDEIEWLQRLGHRLREGALIVFALLQILAIAFWFFWFICDGAALVQIWLH